MTLHCDQGPELYEWPTLDGPDSSFRTRLCGLRPITPRSGYNTVARPAAPDRRRGLPSFPPGLPFQSTDCTVPDDCAPDDNGPNVGGQRRMQLILVLNYKT